MCSSDLIPSVSQSRYDGYGGLFLPTSCQLSCEECCQNINEVYEGTKSELVRFRYYLREIDGMTSEILNCITSCESSCTGGCTVGCEGNPSCEVSCQILCTVVCEVTG